MKDALTTNNAAKAEKLMCGAIKQLKNARLKADIVLNNALTTIALEHTDLLSLPSVVEVGFGSLPHFFLLLLLLFLFHLILLQCLLFFSGFDCSAEEGVVCNIQNS